MMYGNTCRSWFNFLRLLYCSCGAFAYNSLPFPFSYMPLSPEAARWFDDTAYELRLRRMTYEGAGVVGCEESARRRAELDALREEFHERLKYALECCADEDIDAMFEQYDDIFKPYRLFDAA